AIWFLLVILQMESNASSFSPGRLDQYLYTYLQSDLNSYRLGLHEAVELLDALFIKFNQIVYMRNSHSARYFAGFPTGFNVTVGGQATDGTDGTNLLTYLVLKAHEHTRLPQPNLTARIHKGSPLLFLDECSRIIGLGTGMPQIVNDESIVPSLRSAGISKDDALDYVLVGCVELSTQGNFLGWSDAAMFNMVKVLELTLNDGKCIVSGDQTGPATGYLSDIETYSDFESRFAKQMDHFTARMIKACEVVEKCHQQHLPSPFLSSVVNDCIREGKDVTAGGALYNYSGIQAIQPANVADCLAVIQKAIFEDGAVEKKTMLDAILNNFSGYETLRQYCINRVPKYGNDIEWVDDAGAKWISYFADKLKEYSNYRGGNYQMGLYTVSAHVPMGSNVGATPDGRLSGQPLADGGLSPVYGRDKKGPTAALNSVSRIPSIRASNGTLLNMKFLPSVFSSEEDRQKFTSLLRSFAFLPVHHVQFNVVTSDDLIKAQNDPDSYRGLTIRVAGYTAYFTELAEDLQDEIIERTTHGEDK
ncbi:MAG TPA: pyruvate formate lyase family protein, partial [Bacteroidales bacterium]|nr:pyruvate formate lyase family protein [Bacteroidales bacterium]